MRQRPASSAIVECCCASCVEHRLGAARSWALIAAVALFALVALPAFLAWCSSF